LGEAVENCLDRIEELLARAITFHRTAETAVNLLAQAYWAWRPEIEAALQRGVGGPTETAVDLTIANNYFGSALAAALEFGNVSYLAADMEWIRFLLTKPRLPFASPRDYMMAYSAAVRRAMGARGDEIADQLERYAEHG
jgi:hypothetical protein